MNISINWLAVLNKFIDGMIFGLGFILVIILMIWLTKADKDKSKTTSNPKKKKINPVFFNLILIGAMCVNFATSNNNFFLWFLALLTVGCVFLLAIINEESKFLKERIARMDEITPLFSVTPKVGDTVVYVDDFMPDHTEVIEKIEHGFAHFDGEARMCSLSIIRVAHPNEKTSGVREF